MVANLDLHVQPQIWDSSLVSDKNHVSFYMNASKWGTHVKGIYGHSMSRMPPVAVEKTGTVFW